MCGMSGNAVGMSGSAVGVGWKEWSFGSEVIWSVVSVSACTTFGFRCANVCVVDRMFGLCFSFRLLLLVLLLWLLLLLLMSVLLLLLLLLWLLLLLLLVLVLF